MAMVLFIAALIILALIGYSLFSTMVREADLSLKRLAGMAILCLLLLASAQVAHNIF